MILTNPFAELSVSVPSILMQLFVIAMISLVIIGTVMDIIHKKNVKYFFQNAKKAKLQAKREVSAGEKTSIVLKTVAHEILTTSELGAGKRRVAHLLGMYGTIIFWISSVIMIFFYSSTNINTPTYWPVLWHLGALMTCLGGYWFWFFLRVDVSAEAFPWYRIIQADLFVLALIITSTLEEIYAQVKKEGKRVMALVANACATSTGLFDPLDEMAVFCKKHKLWFHVDGAHGAVALLSNKHRQKVKGIEKADSIIWDAHKMLRVPALCTAVLYKKQEQMWNSFHQKGSYVFHENEVIGMDSMPFTVECTKSALGTKLFWSFAMEGQEAIVKFIENSFQQAQNLYNYLKSQEDFYCPYFPQSNILCFQYKPQIINDQKQLALRYKLINSGEFYITSCLIHGKRYLRTVMMNPLTDINDYKALSNAIAKYALTIKTDEN